MNPRRCLLSLFSVELRAEKHRLDGIVYYISSKLRSGNEVGVERCTLKAEEWAALLRAHGL